MASNFADEQFPCWWDIHTHKANPRCRIPNIRVPYGHGRTRVGDWGRVGSCKIVTTGDECRVHPQISCDLVDRLHFCGYPKPILPIHYHYDKRSDEKPPANTMTLFKDLGVSNLLNDPVFGRSSCAAVACCKIVPFLRQNWPNISDDDEKRYRNKKNRAPTKRTNTFLELVHEFTEACLLCGCDSGQVSALLHEIVEFANKPTEGDDQEYKPIAQAFQRKCRRSVVPTSIYSSPLLPVISSIFRIPFCEREAAEVETYLDIECSKCSPTEPSGTFDLEHLATAFDPFLITIAGNRQNSDYLGNGCIRTAGKESSKIMLWAPPIRKRDSVHTIPRIYSAPMQSKTNLPFNTNNFTALQLPNDFLGSNICELDTVQMDDSSVFVLARNTRGQIFSDLLNFSQNDNGFDVTSSPTSSSHQISGYRLSSIAISPWRTNPAKIKLKYLEWAAAGRRFQPSLFSDGHLGVVETYDAKTNQRRWCGQVTLDCSGESISSMMSNSAASSSLDFVDHPEDDFTSEQQSYANTIVYKDLLDYCQQFYRDRRGIYSSPEQKLRQLELDFQLCHASTWLRVGFADSPGALALVTPKRLLTIDTRVRSQDSVTEIFNLTFTPSFMDKGRSFNPAENIQHAQPTWVSDVYAVLATDFNCIVVDKRMPGRPTLQWTHALRGPMAYAEFCEIKEASSDFPAELVLVMASQRSGEMAVTGINLSQSANLAPQLVGPSLSGGTLTDVIDRASEEMPKGILKSQIVAERLSLGFVGSTAVPLSNPAGIRGISMTTAGDVFFHDWYFSQNHAFDSYNEGLNSTRHWCIDFQNDSKKKRVPTENEFAAQVLYPKKDEQSVLIQQTFGQFTQKSVVDTVDLPDDVDYFNEFYADVCDLLDDNEEVSKTLRAARLDEEDKRQEFLDKTINEAENK